ncbi:MAG: hypothetical protein ACRDQF_00630 [Thermocrispum sp.]
MAVAALWTATAAFAIGGRALAIAAADDGDQAHRALSPREVNAAIGKAKSTQPGSTARV